MLTDSHTHSNLSVDGKSSMQEMCAQALRVGIGAVCFTEHVDFDPENPHFGYYDYERVLREAEETREAVGGRIEVGVGVELDLQPPYFAEAAAFLERKKLDLVLGSFHFVNQEFVGTAAYFRTFMPKPDVSANGPKEPYSGNYKEPIIDIDAAAIEKGVAAYFQGLLELALNAEFDVLAHFDLIKWQGAVNWDDACLKRHEAQAREILRVLVSRGKGLEVNTKGLRYSCNEMFPTLRILKAFRELGGEIVTVGSDAHRAEETGMGIRQAYEIVHEAGFKHVAFFRARKPAMTALKA